MDCFFHNAVPSIAQCRGCRKPVCATCRNENGDCPSCVLAARVDGARRSNMIHGGVGPSYGSYQEPPHASAPPPQPPPPPGPPRVQRAAAVAVRPETRAVVALSYPFWPLAIIALVDPKATLFVKRQAWQALGFNLAMWGIAPALLGTASAIPGLAVGTWPLLLFLLPSITLVASVVYAFKVWNGDDVDVPLISDWVDARLPASSPQSQS